MSSTFSELLAKLDERQSLTGSEIESVLDDMLRGQLSTEEMRKFLFALQQKGESVEELVGAARAMRKAMVPIHSDWPVILDTCGTGGDGSQTFNISTAAAIVIAAAGVPVAKHGNRKITSSTGSADVLAELGINLDAPAEAVERCLRELKLCFCFAPRFHPAMKHVGDARRQVVGPTIFNRLGPLCNPASAAYQVLGVGSSDLQDKLADALGQLGTKRSVVVRGIDGVDEVSLENPTRVIEINAGVRSITEWSPADFGLNRSPRSALFADSPAASAECIRQALSGLRSPYRDAVVINAAAGIWLSGQASDLHAAAQMAQEAIDSGRASRLITDLGRLTQSR